MPDEACGLSNWHAFSRARKTALALCLLLLASQVAAHAVGAQAAARIRIAEQAVFIGLIVMGVVAIHQADELIRRMHLAAAGVAFIAAAVVITLFDLLQLAGAFHATLSDVEAALFLPWALVMIYFWWRYR